MLLEAEPRALCMLGNCSTIKLYPKLCFFFFLKKKDFVNFIIYLYFFLYIDVLAACISV